jgi:YfiH family protein
MEIDILTPNIFPKDKIIAGITKRNVESFPPFGLSFSSNDIFTEEQVEKHKIILAKHLGIARSKLIFQHQVHGITIQYVSKNIGYNDSDGLITNERGLFLCIKIADCVAVLCYDKEKNAIGAFHSGWRGTMQNIIQKGILAMKKSFGTNPNNLLVYLSPSASGKNYEIGYDVAQYFPKSTIKISETKYLFDNKKEIILQLMECGVDENNIEVSHICTIENERYHSYRRDLNKSGRMAAFISIK